MRIWALLVMSGVAHAAPPSSYQCTPGTAKQGVGCSCPAGYQDRRDGSNTAICYARHPPSKAALPREGSSARIPFQVSSPAITLVAKPLPPLAPSTTGNADYNAAWTQIRAGKLQAGFDALKPLRVNADLVRVYVEFGAPDRALDMFKSIDPAQASSMADNLGQLYLAKPNADSAAAVYRSLASAYPTHADRCRWLDAAARATSAGTTSLADKASAATALVAEAKRTKAPACRALAAALVTELARWLHADGVRADKLDMQTTAESLYRLYLASFVDLSTENAFYLAELLWTRASKNPTPATWEAAAVAFTEAAKLGKLPANLTKESAYAAILAWKNALKVDARVKAPITPPDDKPTPLDTREQKLVETLELYIATVNANDPELPGVKFMKASLLYRHNRFDDAVPLLRDIVKQHPAFEVAEFAANLALDALNRARRFPEMLAFVDELLANPGFLNRKERLQDTLFKIKRQALLRRGMALEAEGTQAKAVECGRTFIEAYNADPVASDSEMMLGNALVCFEKGEAWAAWLQTFAVYEKYFAKAAQFSKFKAIVPIAKSKLTP
jgi:tetratricopeptide (TPR) repeat protein